MRGVSSTTYSDSIISPVSGSSWGISSSLLSQPLSLYLFLPLRPSKVGPLNLLYSLHHGPILILHLGCVGDLYLVALEYLDGTTLATAGPATVSLPIEQVLTSHLAMDRVLGPQQRSAPWWRWQGQGWTGSGRGKKRDKLWPWCQGPRKCNTLCPPIVIFPGHPEHLDQLQPSELQLFGPFRSKDEALPRNIRQTHYQFFL